MEHCEPKLGELISIPARPPDGYHLIPEPRPALKSFRVNPELIPGRVTQLKNCDITDGRKSLSYIAEVTGKGDQVKDCDLSCSKETERKEWNRCSVHDEIYQAGIGNEGVCSMKMDSEMTKLVSDGNTKEILKKFAKKVLVEDCSHNWLTGLSQNCERDSFNACACNNKTSKSTDCCAMPVNVNSFNKTHCKKIERMENIDCENCVVKEKPMKNENDTFKEKRKIENGVGCFTCLKTPSFKEEKRGKSSMKKFGNHLARPNRLWPMSNQEISNLSEKKTDILELDCYFDEKMKKNGENDERLWENVALEDCHYVKLPTRMTSRIDDKHSISSIGMVNSKPYGKIDAYGMNSVTTFESANNTSGKCCNCKRNYDAMSTSFTNDDIFPKSDRIFPKNDDIVNPRASQPEEDRSSEVYKEQGICRGFGTIDILAGIEEYMDNCQNSDDEQGSNNDDEDDDDDVVEGSDYDKINVVFSDEESLGFEFVKTGDQLQTILPDEYEEKREQRQHQKRQQKRRQKLHQQRQKHQQLKQNQQQQQEKQQQQNQEIQKQQQQLSQSWHSKSSPKKILQVQNNQQNYFDLTKSCIDNREDLENFEQKGPAAPGIKKIFVVVAVTVVLVGILVGTFLGVVLADLIHEKGSASCGDERVLCDVGCVSIEIFCKDTPAGRSFRAKCTELNPEKIGKNHTDFDRNDRTRLFRPELYIDVKSSLEKPVTDEAGWTSHTDSNGKRSLYHIVHKSLTFPGAQEHCRKLGGYLVHINSLREQIFIEDFISLQLQQDELLGEGAGFWLGARRPRGGHSGTCMYDQWRWVDSYGRSHGSIAGFTAFIPGKPDNFYNPEECLYMSPEHKEDESRYLKWDDAPCDLSAVPNIRILCEVEKQPSSESAETQQR